MTNPRYFWVVFFCSTFQAERVGAEQRRGGIGGGGGGRSSSALLKGCGGDPRHGIQVYEGGLSFKCSSTKACHDRHLTTRR